MYYLEKTKAVTEADSVTGFQVSLMVLSLSHIFFSALKNPFLYQIIVIAFVILMSPLRML